MKRFTRDRASKYVWAAMFLAALIGLALATTTGSRALDDERATSADRAIRYVTQVLDPRLDGDDLVAPITGPPAASLKALVDRSILIDDRIARVRIWSTDGTLLFSTDRSDRPGSNADLNDIVLRQAAREGPISRTDFSDTGGVRDKERSLFRTYAPLGATAVAEIDQTDEGTLGPVRYEWRSYQILAGALALLFLVMTALSLRDPIERINVGVPFADSSIPEGFSLIDDDRLHAVHEVYRLASERVARLQEKLSRSEEARRRLEGDIQRALSKAGSSEANSAAPAASVAPPAARPTPEPAIVQVPESEVVADRLGDSWAAAAAGPLARAARPQKPAPTTSSREKPAVEKPKRAPRRQKEEPEKPAAAPPEAVKPAPTPTREVARVAAAPRAAPEPTRAPEPARTPEPARAPEPAPDPEIKDAKAHAAALETFIRLTESDRQPLDTSTVDQGAVRAALARTPARKKPGGERLQPHEGPHGASLGGPPTDRE